MSTRLTQSIRQQTPAHKFSGFTLVEAMIIISLIAIIAIIAAPNLIAWRDKAKLRAAADNLKGDLELAKLKAIQINGSVAINCTANNYKIFEDNGATAHVRDSGEQLIKSRTLPTGVRIDISKPAKISFTGRGTADSGTIQLQNTEGEKKQIIVSPVGRIRIGND